MPATTFPVRHQWDPSLPIKVNTTVVILPGRGETPGSYQRLGARLAYDTLDVTVLDPAESYSTTSAEPAEQVAARLAAEIIARADAAGTRHLVLIGHDAGANLALHVAAQLGARLTALVLSSPGRGALTTAVDWPAELALRSACPSYTGALDKDPRVRRGTLVVPAEIAAPVEALRAGTAGIDAPVLLLTGGDDPLPDEALLKLLRESLPRVRGVRVRGAKHDVLNDVTSRSVSAEIVAFVEWARSGNLDEPILHIIE